MIWWLASPVVVVIALAPKAPGVFAYWHRWRGFGVERDLITRVRFGFWSYDFMPGSLAERIAKVIDAWLIVDVRE